VLLLRAIPASTGANAPLPEPPTEPEVEQRAPILPRESSPAAVGLPPSPFPAQSLAVGSGLRLALVVEESCWLEIAADGEVVVSGLKEQGFRQEVTATRELRLWLGNAGGVKVLLNDEPAIPLGRPGQVRKDLTITLDNYRDFVSKDSRS
jgi:hypothetical protein